MKKDVFNQYVDAIVSKFDIEREELFTATKRREIVDARQMLYYLCSIRPMTIGYIQRYMTANGYNPQHPPIINGIKRVKSKIETDRDYQSVINSIQNSVFI
jgi:chromosomal replication initiation ATPase DnaA